MNPVGCLACQTTGVGQGQGVAPVGQLLPLCLMCDGAGTIRQHGDEPTPYIAIWLVGNKYAVRMTVPWRRGVVELDLEWSPSLPPKKGPGKLKAHEMAQYRAGRDQALRTLNLELGGDYSIVEAGDRH